MKYKVIYADPPWDYKDKRDKHIRICGGATSHYPTMTIKELKAKAPEVKNISDDDCIIFMWVTFPILKEGLELIEEWGFKYKTLGFSWIKLNKKNKKPFFGIGHYTKSNCEVCLIGIKGRPQIESDEVSSVLLSVKRQHSRKPDEVYERIEKLMGNVPMIELFARQKRRGWGTYGNETTKRPELTMLKDFID